MGADKEEAFHQMIAAVREGRWTDAEQAGLDSLWAKQTSKPLGEADTDARHEDHGSTSDWGISVNGTRKVMVTAFITLTGTVALFAGKLDQGGYVTLMSMMLTIYAPPM